MREARKETLAGLDARELRRELQCGDDADLRWRRRVIGFSLVGMAAMAAVSLLQTGVVDHLPDPPVGNIDSDKVNSSETAYRLGAPDGTVSLASLAANVPLAAFGGADRARRFPWLPPLIAAKAVAEAVVAGWYFYRMPVKEKAWCVYCITGAAANLAVAISTIPEARRALSR